MVRALVLAYGIFAYIAFLTVFVLFVAFVAGADVLVVTRMRTDLVRALAFNLGFVVLAGLQYSLMSAASFREFITKLIPASVERSTFVLGMAFCLTVLVLYWHPVDGVVWSLSDPLARMALWTLFSGAWGSVVVLTLRSDHLTFFGVRQALALIEGDDGPDPRPGMDRATRIVLRGAILIGLWATPMMTATHFVLAVGLSGCVLVCSHLSHRGVAREGADTRREALRLARLKVYAQRRQMAWTVHTHTRPLLVTE
jgi:hypothetical protein